MMPRGIRCGGSCAHRAAGLLVMAVMVAASACSSDAPTTIARDSSGSTASSDGGLPHSIPTAEGIDTSQLRTLEYDANQQQTDAVVLLRNRKVIYEDYYSQGDVPILSESVSKSFVSLAFGYLLQEHRLSSLDVHVVDILPTFADVDVRKRDMTIRQLLSNSSGIDPTRAAVVNNVMGDAEARGIASKLEYAPGTGWQYANNGFDLLSVLAQHLAGEPIDTYLQRKLFAPLGISTASWIKDISGVPIGDYGLMIRPLDLAKVGQVILDGGTWNGSQVIPNDWIATVFAQSQQPEPDYGLGWWRLGNATNVSITQELLDQWRSMGLSTSITSPLEAIADKSYTSTSALYSDVHNLVGDSLYAVVRDLIANGDHFPPYRIQGFTSVGNEAEGWLGQYLVIFPSKNLVGVRMRRPFPSDYVNPNASSNTDSAFPGDVYRLAP